MSRGRATSGDPPGPDGGAAPGGAPGPNGRAAPIAVTWDRRRSAQRASCGAGAATASSVVSSTWVVETGWWNETTAT